MLSVDKRSCLLECNREVTWISGRGHVYTRVTEVEEKFAKVCVELLRSCEINNLVAVLTTLRSD